VEGRREWVHAAFSGANIRFGVAELDGAIAGWLSFREFSSAFVLIMAPSKISVYVSEQVRRRGVARKLLAEAGGARAQLGMHSLVGLIFSNNEPSLRDLPCRWVSSAGVCSRRSRALMKPHADPNDFWTGTFDSAQKIGLGAGRWFGLPVIAVQDCAANNARAWARLDQC